MYFFSHLQASMDLPPDKAKLLKNYDNEKKWDMILDIVSSSNSELIALMQLTQKTLHYQNFDSNANTNNNN